MKYWGALPSRIELDAGTRLSREEYERWLRVAEIGENLASFLHGTKNVRSAEKAESAVKEILASGHDLDDGSVFDCSTCWQATIDYKKTGVVSVPEKAPRSPSVW